MSGLPGSQQVLARGLLDSGALPQLLAVCRAVATGASWCLPALLVEYTNAV